MLFDFGHCIVLPDGLYIDTDDGRVWIPSSNVRCAWLYPDTELWDDALRTALVDHARPEPEPEPNPEPVKRKRGRPRKSKPHESRGENA